MKAYSKALKQVLFGVKPYDYTAEVERSELVSSASIGLDEEGAVLTVNFVEAIKDGNQIDGMVVLNGGRAIDKKSLLPGETKASLFFDGFDIGGTEYEITLVDTDEQVIETTEIQIHEVQR
ncbi:hypothetical protein [Haloarcula sp. 1CSR25-25]|jgi:hypothetical protein|uniref:hypothetical protein n=1 Tax=Haloarcula sp. 1CSR25-25 TaxID=2862545 RepID=UPI0028959410|nr:hypothetical protein [Haloarcula sp. 1CSR25-25]MDT3437849.1 hypothetical protein [Haloarcula sp. 1CSR25-25]